jgi:hypothetical protein
MVSGCFLNSLRRMQASKWIEIGLQPWTAEGGCPHITAQHVACGSATLDYFYFFVLKFFVGFVGAS